MTINCSKCEQEMEIDTGEGVPYVTEKNGAIHCVVCVEVPSEGV